MAGTEFCAIVCGYDDYRQYAPLFTGSMLYAYPEAFVRLYMRGVPSQCQRQLDYVRANISDRFEIVLDWMAKARTHRQLQSARWFINPEPLMRFRYCYWCDIDFIILPIMPDLVQRHCVHMQQIGMPYSNIVRSPSGQLPHKLTGLHFIETQPYYEKVTPQLISSTLQRCLKHKIHNEVILYQFMKEAFGMPTVVTENRFRPHHGFHLAKTRKPRGHCSQTKLTAWRDDYIRTDNMATLLMAAAGDTKFGPLLQEFVATNYQVAAAMALARNHLTTLG